MRKRKKKKKKKIPIKLQLMQTQIDLHSDKLNNPEDMDFKKINSHSWIDYNVSSNPNLFSNELEIKVDEVKKSNKKKKKTDNDDEDEDGWFTQKIRMYPSKIQKKILIIWMNCYIAMYNQISRYIRTEYYKYKHYVDHPYPITNLTKLKKLFYKKKQRIINSHVFYYNKEILKKKAKKIPQFLKYKIKTRMENDKKNGIIRIYSKTKTIIEHKQKRVKCNSHSLDYAIKDALNRYRTCMSNIKNGNIRSFKLRDLKYTKPKKIIKIEKYAMHKDGFCISSLGKMYCEIPNFDYDSNAKTITTIQYNSKTKEFIMLMKYRKKEIKRKNPNSIKEDIVSIDPGIRTMITLYGSNKVEEIGTVCSKKIKRQLKRIDRIDRNKELEEKKKRKIINKKYKKIKNRIKDIHWKIAHYLTDNYKTIIIGNFSTKKMGKRIAKMTKRIGGMLSFYKFRQILKYICKYKNVKYREIDEAYTSKCCSNCGYYKKDLGANKVYECNECKTVMDRDINGAKNILMLSL